MEERRHYTRVPTRLTAHARITSSLKDEPRFSVGNFSPGPSASLKGAKLPAPMIEFLTGLDKKLDLLLAQNSLESVKNDYPIKLDVREISGNGIRFIPTSKTPDSTCLEVVLLLRQAPLRLVAAKGRVIQDKDEPTSRFEFTTIRGTDLEILISFAFEEERQRIRTLKISR